MTVNPNCRPIIIVNAKMGVVYRLGGVLREEVGLGKWSRWVALGDNLGGSIASWGYGVDMLVHCLVEVWVGESDLH